MDSHEGFVDGIDQNRVDMLCPPRTIRKRPSAEANLNADQPTEAPAIRLSQSRDEDSDTDSTVCMLPHFKLEQKIKRKEQQKRGKWVNRAIKCCNCDRTSSTTNKCDCGHKRCDTCFHYSEKPDVRTHDFNLAKKVPECDHDPAEEVPNWNHDDIWRRVKVTSDNASI
ncbi:hypothetical protein EMCG_07353 [[Emmonsia] crescens]|uniref:Uncharacterized protein n=1 Tax=[Emmonsia] crescens TaxID=73230 RepID=A0A0G2JB69_9EURO|nr:hypothetical protein EMCG_07353 [Emmonsia crescens UAMH 3008]